VQGNFLASEVDEPNHWPVMGVLGTWALLSFALERVRQGDRVAAAVPYLWAALDCLLFTICLHLAHGPRELLLAGYPLLIAASGLWFRVRMVWFMMVLCLAAFGGLVLADPWSAPVPPHYPGLFAAMLLIVGMIVAYQVRRIRVLSRYFEQRGAPRTTGRL
jgi:eukaryotic-like serine/threonine-protein kinase